MRAGVLCCLLWLRQLLGLCMVSAAAKLPAVMPCSSGLCTSFAPGSLACPTLPGGHLCWQGPCHGLNSLGSPSAVDRRSHLALKKEKKRTVCSAGQVLAWQVPLQAGSPVPAPLRLHPGHARSIFSLHAAVQQQEGPQAPAGLQLGSELAALDLPECAGGAVTQTAAQQQSARDAGAGPAAVGAAQLASSLRLITTSQDRQMLCLEVPLPLDGRAAKAAQVGLLCPAAAMHRDASLMCCCCTIWDGMGLLGSGVSVCVLAQ